ncbi:MAG: DUF4330 family protein [Oscillospiraceae bacterium]|jgi:hypothetical protein|nr:DUF4330 family protein [Oscillospiraceae bacterium]
MKHKKWNVVDLVIVIVVVVLLIFGCVKLFGGKGGLSDATTTQITYTVKVCGIEKESYASIQKYVPGELMASGAKVDGSVTKTTSEPSVVYVNLNSNGPMPALLPVQSNDLVDVVFTIEAKAEAGDVLTSKVGTQEVRIGKSHIIKTEYIELTGTVLTVDWKE